MSSTGKDVGKSYINFLRNSAEQLRNRVIDELLVLGFFEVFCVFEYLSIQILTDLNFSYDAVLVRRPNRSDSRLAQ